MPVYVGVPSGDGPWPGVLVISDALGMTTDLRAQVDWLAGAGYLAAAPDLYYWGGRKRCLFTTVRQALSGRGAIYEDFETVRAWLADHASGTGRVGVVGFCLGGGFALTLATRGDFAVAASNYGALTKEALAGLARSCPIVGSYGGRDRSLRKVPGQIASVLKEYSVPFDIKVYPDAGHSFMNDHVASEEPKWSVIMGKFAASGYHEPSAHDARDRIVAFFQEHLA
jgi:carboxymethylenebutenolidase